MLMCCPTTLTAVWRAQVGQLLHTLVPHANNIPIVVRVSFVLGNVTASELSSRQELSAAGGNTLTPVIEFRSHMRLTAIACEFVECIRVSNMRF